MANKRKMFGRVRKYGPIRLNFIKKVWYAGTVRVVSQAGIFGSSSGSGRVKA